MPDNLTKEQRSRIMSRIRRRDTKPELLLRKALWARGLRGYRLDFKQLPGRPDIVWTRHRLVVFVDGAFWHGHPSAFTHGKSGEYWDEKISRNIRRDREAGAALLADGWTVIRLWDFEIRRSLGDCLTKVEAALLEAEEGA
jgi:DNA mismatch endonuclease (patch repair protein)